MILVTKSLGNLMLSLCFFHVLLGQIEFDVLHYSKFKTYSEGK